MEEISMPGNFKFIFLLTWMPWLSKYFLISEKFWYCGINSVLQNTFLDVNLIQDGSFPGCSRLAGTKRTSSLKSVRYILQWRNLQSYTLPKEEWENIWITWRTPWVLMASAFFHRKSATFVISRNAYTDCILIHIF